MEWTENQKKIIDFGSGDLLVSASAGSGKTTVMLGRVIRLIEDGYSLKNMLISTFTVSAADDMRAKLSKNLTKAYAETGEARYAEELEYLPSADICTLHKWCQKLIRRYFYVTGDDPAFEIAEESECGVWRNEAISAAIAEAADDPQSDYAAVASLYVRRRSDSAVRRIVRTVMLYADSQPDADEWIASAASRYADDSPCRDYLSAVADSRFRSICADADALEASADALGLPKAKPLLEEVRANLCGACVPYSRAVGITPVKEEFDALKKRVAAYNEFLDRLASAQGAPAERAAKLFLRLASRARELYAEKKTEKGKLDFTDLERKAKQILASAEGGVVRASLTHVFIDEYQDINPLQESIIGLLGDNLFFVGDIKQSIYAFRNCSPAAFASKRDELSGGGNLVELNKNYRSKSGILRFSNAVFSRVMTENFGRVDYAGGARFAVDEADGDDGSVEILLTPQPEIRREQTDFSDVYSVKNHVGRTKIGRAEVEADAVTEKIVSLLSDKEAGYKYGDIAVLVRTRSGAADVIARNLRAIGIPVSVSSKSGVGGGRCNRLLLSYLKLIDNFRDDVSLTAVMRSSLGGFSDAELAAVRAACPDEQYFFSCVLKAGESDGKVRDFLNEVKKYTELSAVLGVGELAGRITSEKKLFGTALSENLGIAKADGLGRLLANMSSFGGTLSDYLEYVSEVEPSVDTPPQPGSVRIMTVHASKGLEFPVVLMCGLHAPFRTDTTAGELCDGDFGLGLESRIAESGETLPSVPLLAARERKRLAESEEEMRILYVALTRAKDKLVLFLRDAPPKPKPPEEANCFADWIYPSAVAHGMKPAEKAAGVSESRAEPPEIVPATLEALRAQISFDCALPVRPLKKSVTTLLAERDFSLAEEGDLAAEPPAITAAEYDGADAMARGTAFHAALERMDFSSPFDEQLPDLKSVWSFSDEDVDKLRAAHSAISEEISGYELYREQPFLMSAGGIDGLSDGTVLQGVIDLLAVRGSESEIIDYKTGHLDGERRAKYSAQLDVYAAAVKRVLGISVARKRVYLIDSRRFWD